MSKIFNSPVILQMKTESVRNDCHSGRKAFHLKRTGLKWKLTNVIRGDKTWRRNIACGFLLSSQWWCTRCGAFGDVFRTRNTSIVVQKLRDFISFWAKQRRAKCLSTGQITHVFVWLWNGGRVGVKTKKPKDRVTAITEWTLFLMTSKSEGEADAQREWRERQLAAPINERSGACWLTYLWIMCFLRGHSGHVWWMALQKPGQLASPGFPRLGSSLCPQRAHLCHANAR